MLTGSFRGGDGFEGETSVTDAAVGEGTDGSSGRASYLIEGRRVRVSDLVDAGLLPAGTRLTLLRSGVRPPLPVNG